MSHRVVGRVFLPFSRRPLHCYYFNVLYRLRQEEKDLMYLYMNSGLIDHYAIGYFLPVSVPLLYNTRRNDWQWLWEPFHMSIVSAFPVLVDKLFPSR